MLFHIHGILKPDQLALCRRLMGDDAPWIDGRGSAGSVAGQVKNNMEISQHDPVAQQLGQIVVDAMTATPAFHTTALPIRFSPPSFSRYEGGQGYGLHNDAAILEFKVNGAPLLVRTDLAATLFISAPEAYDGGELTVEDTFGFTNVKLPAGDMVLYPASSLHRVQPVTRGRRLVSFFWIQSLVPDDQHRTMLRDLDITMQQLNISAPDNPAMVRLMGLYHNLLRLWSET